ncbi:hypothetical protein DSO57_1020908 [Entomophthora muscae]|uniref:Uncharacterized protein n=1 Tax=Entomophthora muscae TaxID=34485 RepID=A0ACC2SG92_9FUNG|nr:hypothetical protein DSO57_1020908 [Entomophthora muscae]
MKPCFYVSQKQAPTISKKKLTFNQCSVEVICSKPTVAPPLTTTPPPALAALLKEYKDVFSETFNQLLSRRLGKPENLYQN